MSSQSADMSLASLDGFESSSASSGVMGPVEERDFFGQPLRTPPKPLGQRVVEMFTDKGSIANLCSFAALVLGLIIVASTPPGVPDRRSVTCPPPAVSGGNVFGQYVLAFGLFGFAGGITNWLAVKMLFDRVCGLPGSGVIPNRFREIRTAIKDMILSTFFEKQFLEDYLEQKAGQLAASVDIEHKISDLLQSAEVDAIIDSKLGELGNRPEGMVLAMLGIEISQLKPILTPFVVGMGTDMAPLLMDAFDAKSILNADNLRREVELLADAKLAELSPAAVKSLMQRLIRDHLGWLVVWGNVFGGVLGLLARAVGY